MFPPPLGERSLLPDGSVAVAVRRRQPAVPLPPLGAIVSAPSDGRRYKKEKGERKERTTDGRTDAVFLVGFWAAAAAAAAGGRGGGGRFADVAVAANERCPVGGRTVTARAGEGEGGLPTTHIGFSRNAHREKRDLLASLSVHC